MVQRERAVAAARAARWVRDPWPGGVALNLSMGRHTMTETTKAAAQAKSSPALVLTPNTTSRPTHAGLQHRGQHPAGELGRPAVEPDGRVVERDGRHRRHRPDDEKGGRGRVVPDDPENSCRVSTTGPGRTTDRTRTTKQAMANPVAKMTRRVAASIESISVRREDGYAEHPDGAEERGRRGCRCHQAHVARRVQPGGEQPVNEAEHGGGTLLGDEIGEGREEPFALGRMLRRFVDGDVAHGAGPDTTAQGREALRSRPGGGGVHSGPHRLSGLAIDAVSLTAHACPQLTMLRQ